MYKDYIYIIEGNSDDSYIIGGYDDINEFQQIKNNRNFSNHIIYYVEFNVKPSKHIFRNIIISESNEFHSYKKTIEYIHSFKRIHKYIHKPNFSEKFRNFLIRQIVPGDCIEMF